MSDVILLQDNTRLDPAKIGATLPIFQIYHPATFMSLDRSKKLWEVKSSTMKLRQAEAYVLKWLQKHPNLFYDDERSKLSIRWARTCTENVSKNYDISFCLKNKKVLFIFDSPSICQKINMKKMSFLKFSNMKYKNNLFLKSKLFVIDFKLSYFRFIMGKNISYLTL